MTGYDYTREIELTRELGIGDTLLLYDGEQLIVGFPGVTLAEYIGPPGGGKLYVGQAGQLVVNVSGNATVAQLRSYLLTLPGLSASTVSALQSISAWQTTIPLGIPTDPRPIRHNHQHP